MSASGDGRNPSPFGEEDGEITEGYKPIKIRSKTFQIRNLSDMETCYKMFRREILQSILIEEQRFGFEPEITAKVARLRCRIYEVGISYYGRTYEQGKKIGWKDGVRAIYAILKYNIFKPIFGIRQ